MHFSKIVSLFAAITSSVLCYAPPRHYPRDVSSMTAPEQLPFNFTYLFTAHLALGPAEKPIPIDGGVLVIEPILNGTVTGPAINATLGYSLATPSVVNNGTLQRPIITAVGKTDDGFNFYLYETGVGATGSQVTRIEVDIGGGAKYAALRDGYVLASVHASADRTSVEVMGYLVQN